MSTKSEQVTPIDQSAEGVVVHRPCWALAQKIATAILTVHGQDGSEECTRAQMMLKQTDGSEINMGGRCKASLVECIAEKLESAWPNVELSDSRPL